MVRPFGTVACTEVALEASPLFFRIALSPERIGSFSQIVKIVQVVEVVQLIEVLKHFEIRNPQSAIRNLTPLFIDYTTQFRLN
jgi:hypothetical protein